MRLKVPEPGDQQVQTVRRALLEAARQSGVDAEQPLALPLFLAASVRSAEAFMRDAVLVDRASRALTWSDIGRAFGITMPSAHHRFAPQVRAPE